MKSHLVVKFDERREFQARGFKARQSFNRRARSIDEGAPNTSCNYILPERIVYTSRELVLCAHFPTHIHTHTRMYIHTAKSYQRIRAAQGVPFEHEGSCPRAQVPSFIIADKQTTRELHARERDNVASLTKPQIIITDACSPS